MIILLLTSCRSYVNDRLRLDNQENKENQSLSPPSNVSKVLNNVLCSDCNQDQINSIWNKCLENGYVQSSPNRKVRSSRNLSELISLDYTQYQTRYYTRSEVDSNGIVTDTQHSSQVPITTRISGQCRGTEYIWE